MPLSGFPLLVRTPDTLDERPTYPSVPSSLRLQLQIPQLQIRSYSKVLVVKPSTRTFWGDPIQPIAEKSGIDNCHTLGLLGN